MVDVLIPREPIPVSLTADQVVAYLLRSGSGWYHRRYIGSPWKHFIKGDLHIEILHDGRSEDSYSLMVDVQTIARAESRPALDVATDIAGPAVGVGGVGCEPAPARPRPIAKLRCFWRLQREREGVEVAKKKAKMARFYDDVETPHAPVEE